MLSSSLTPSGGRGEMGNGRPLLPSLVQHSIHNLLLGQPLSTGSFLRPDHRNVCEKIEGDRPTEMGERVSQRDPTVFQVSPRRESAQRTQSVRRARRQRDGGFPRAFLQGSASQSGLLRFVHFYLHRGSEAVSYLVRFGAHKVSTRPPRGRCSLT